MGVDNFGFDWGESKTESPQPKQEPQKGGSPFDALSRAFSHPFFQQKCEQDRGDLKEAYQSFLEANRMSTKGQLDTLNGDMLKDYQAKNASALEKKGKTILDLKQALNTQLGLCLEVNNTFDTDTLKALLGFQRKSDLRLSGVCDSKTQKSLFQISQTASLNPSSHDEIDSQPVPRGVEKKNVRYLAKDGKSVLDLKKQLNDELGLNLPQNNDFDGQTYGALKAFQTKHHLEPDGLCGPNTKRILFEESLGATVRRGYGKLKSGVDRFTSHILSAPFEKSENGTTLCSRTAIKNLNQLGVSGVPGGKSAREAFNNYPSSKVRTGFDPDAKVADVFLDAASAKNKQYGHRVAAFNSEGNWYVLDPYLRVVNGKTTREPIPLDTYVSDAQRKGKRIWGAVMYS